MYQSTSYLIAIETNSKIPQGMYINVKEPIYSFRSANYNGKEVLLIGGSGHKTGEPIENNYHYEELEKKAKELYPDCKVIFKWNTRDCIGLDKIPYIGEFSNMMKNLYVGTGFKKWGMTLSNVAANIVTDKILEKENKFEDIFNATRMKPIKNRWEVKNMLKETVNSMALNKLKIEPEVTDEYVPIKFLWTGDNEGYWIKTDQEDKEWYSIEEGIYPCFVNNPQITEMTFRINGENNDYEVITGWEGKFYIWLPKLETEEYQSGLFASKEKGTLLLYDNGWENTFNQTYSGKIKIDLLPEKIQEKLLNAYKIYTDNMQNQNIQDEEINEEENKPENQE